jgi:NCS2 family nucleobase:cation symporter-2
MARPGGLLYAVDETPPRTVLAFSTVQHVAVMSSSLLYPVILASEAQLSGTRLFDMAALSMVALGVATALLCMRSRFVGSGYLCPAGFSLIYIGPSLYALQHGGLAVVFGMTALAGFLQLAIAQFLPRLRALLPPEIAGLVIAITGLSLAVLGVRYCLGVSVSGRIEPHYAAVAAVSLVTMIVLNIWTTGYTKMFSGLIGASVGMALSALFGIGFLSPLPQEGLPLLRIPGIEHLDWRFDAAMFAPFAVAAIASTVHLMGNISTAQKINDADWVRPDFGSLRGGLAGNGIASMCCGLLGSPGVISSTANIGLSGSDGITSRRLGYFIGGALVLLALAPWAVFFLTATTAPVMGALLVFTSLFVFTNGLQMITARMLDPRKTVVIGFAFAMAVMADVYRDVFATMPAALQPLFGNSLVLGTTCAVLLNLVMRIGVRQRETLQLALTPERGALAAQFLAEQGARWAARRDVVERARFCLLQALEVLGEPSGGIGIEASFDEFNLDLRIHYSGAPLVLPERQPDRSEILASDAGEQLLAGFLLRRSADRVQVTHRSGRSTILFHFDH